MSQSQPHSFFHSWPAGAVDSELSDLQERYFPDLHHVDMEGLIQDKRLGRLALVSSFGAESAVLLHYVSRIIPEIPVIFIDTGKHFPATLEYRDLLAELMSLNLNVVESRQDDLDREDPDGLLHQRDTDSCCAIRKTFPLQDALSGYDSWLSGRKRFQASSRAALPLLERDGAKIKINPLALWDRERLLSYFANHDLPRHPLEAQGYLSIGCFPCTSKVADGADPRSGRWAEIPDKTECGIHLGPDGTFKRSGSSRQID